MDLQNCNVEVTEKTYFGWFYCEDIRCNTVQANCGSCSDIAVDRTLSCYDVWSDNAGIAWSDRRIKKDIKPIENALDYILSLRPVSYKLKKFEGIHYGLIAQEVLEGGDPYGIVDTMENGYYAISYGKLDGVLVKAMQELKELSDDL
jgi:hypothetical protein